MKFSICLLCSLMLFQVAVPKPSAGAEMYYVTPTAEVVVRRGQGTEYKVIAMVRDGERVELLEDGSPYARVGLADGSEGWMLKRYLSRETPLRELVEELGLENERMRKEEAENLKKIREAAIAFAQKERELVILKQERDRLAGDYQALLQDSGNVTEIKSRLNRAEEENKRLVRSMSALQAEQKKLQDQKAVKWFLAGGGVLLTGICLGGWFGRSRKKRSSLL